jgi:hypothetical protein
MSSQVEPTLTECDAAAVTEREQRHKRRGLLRTDTHTLYDIPFQALGAAPTEELQRIAKNKDESYSPELQAEASSIIRARVDPQDRNAVETEM